MIDASDIINLPDNDCPVSEAVSLMVEAAMNCDANAFDSANLDFIGAVEDKLSNIQEQQRIDAADPEKAIDRAMDGLTRIDDE